MKYRIIIMAAAVMVLAGCGRSSFSVSGHVGSAEGETVYLEHLGLGETQVLDSVVLKKSGSFRFREARPEYPDLYRLRMDGSTLVLAVDSLEQIVVECDESLSDAVITGSPKSEQIRALRRSLRENTPEAHKAYAREVILSDPSSMVAYYALFQQKAGLPVFDVYDKSDRVCFNAVATSFHTWMPDYSRSKVLYNQVLEVINNERHAQQVAAMQAFIEESENTFLDITLPDEDGVEQSLSQYKGKFIVVDFATTLMDRYTGYVFEMKEIYNAFHSRGVEIYEVYPDPSRLMWEEQVRALPWTTVRTENGVNDQSFISYNVRTLPTLFLYNPKGEIIGRYADFKGLRGALEKALSERTL